MTAPLLLKTRFCRNNFTKNLKAYFGENFATEFKEGLTAKMNSGDERNYDAYTSAFGTLGLLADSVIEPNTGKRIPYMTWITDSVFNVNSNQFEKCFKKNDSIWSKTQFDTLGSRVVDTFKTKFNYFLHSIFRISFSHCYFSNCNSKFCFIIFYIF